VLPVPTVTIYPGDTIADEQLADQMFPQARFATGYLDARRLLVGKVARRTLLPGRPVARNAVTEADLVARGAPVRLVFQAAGLEIVAFATPLQDGGAGDAIRVRNLDSGAIVTGVVQEDGTVRVGAP
jgi:flagella basal body P-ring formation protein FlgA